MSDEFIYLITFRIEISDHLNLLESIHYTASHLEKRPKRKTHVDAETIRKTWGSRRLREIQIETFNFDDMTENDHSDLNQDSNESVDIISDIETSEIKGMGSDVSHTRKEADGAFSAPHKVPPLVGSDTQDVKTATGARPRMSPILANIGVDNRFSPIGASGSPIMLDDEPPTPSSMGPGSGAVRGRPMSHSPKVSSSIIGFFSGNQKSVLTEGIIHLFKDSQPTPLGDEVSRSEVICILAVPASLNTHDLLDFTAPVYPGIKEMRIIRDSTPNQYMVLMTFKSQSKADEFYKAYNAKAFNSLEPDVVCHLVFVSRVETVNVSEGGCLPDKDQLELPKCPVCLERMDESVDGILTTQCNHSFHGFCLSKWGDNSCPVCRCVQTPELVEDNQCSVCGATESLWICVICGSVGCGRYVETHAYEHFKETQHPYALHIGTTAVWDYISDRYVQRLIQSKGDGKPVQYTDSEGNEVDEQKADNLALQYTYFFTQQLQNQRRYFEEQIARLENQTQDQVTELEGRLKTEVDKCEKLEKELKISSKDKTISEKRCIQLGSKISKLSSELQDEKEMNKSLSGNQKEWQVKVSVLEAQMRRKDEDVSELQDQLRDIMFSLEAQHKLADCSEITAEELEQGQIVVSPGTESASSRRRAKKKQR